MNDPLLAELLERNEGHVQSLEDRHFDAVQEAQYPAVVSVCCSDSRVSQEGMWDVDEPGWLFTPSVIGNQVWDARDGDRFVEGSTAYPLVHVGTEVAAVVGHTQCGAVTAAYDRVRGDAGPEPEGIEKWIDLLVPVVEAGLAGPVDGGDDRTAVIDQLVEYNVRRQVEFLSGADEVPDETRVYGFVYDFVGRYGADRGRTYLVSADGETDPDVLAELVPRDLRESVRTLLD